MSAFVAAVLMVAAPPASAATVSGTVTSNGTTGIEEVCVQLQSPTQPWQVLYSADPSTNVFGQYSIPDVTPGSYKVSFFHCPSLGSPAWVPEFAYNRSGWESADVLTVLEPTTTINAVLVPGHTISGRVTSNGSTPLQHICVSAFLAGAQQGPGVAGSETDVNGVYTMGPVPYGQYKVRFNDCNQPATRVPQWYSGKTSFETADVVDAASTNATDIDAVMSQTGYTISGRVTNGATGLPEVCVQVFNSSTQMPVGWGGRTDANGFYTTEPVAPGQYKIKFNECIPSPTYLEEWWNDKQSFGAADVINLTSGNAIDKDAVLATGFTISGQVTNGSTGIEGICVLVFPPGAGQPSIKQAQTAADGTYSVGPLANGQYKLLFRDCRTTPVYIAEWWDNKSDQSSADAITISSANVTGKNAVLIAGRTVSGRVTSDGSTGIQGVCVNLANSQNNWFMGMSANTRADGTYTSEPVAPGQYRLQFSDCRQSPVYATEWYDNQYNAQNATIIDLSSANASGKDADLDPGFSISGTVTDGSTGVQGICVSVQNTAWTYPSWQAGGAMTQAGGTYTTSLLPPGQYKVQFSDCRPSATLIGEWWDNKADYASADPITIIGSNVTGKNAALTPGHTIQGYVTDGATGIYNIAVAAYPVSGPGPVPGQNPPFFTFTDNSGHYRLGPLPSDNYKITFVDWQPPTEWFSEWYDNKADFASGTAVNSATDPTAVNAVLEPGRTISGKVTSNGTTGIEHVCVSVFSASDRNGEGVAGMQTDASGNYTVGPLHDGQQYILQFQDCNTTPQYIAEWWNDKPDNQSADAIAIAGANVTGKDAVLAAGHAISGTVTGSGAGNLQYICVQATAANDPDMGMAWAETDSSGHYRLGPLPAGQYKVQFNNCNEPRQWVQEWWNDKSQFEQADPITLSTSDVTTINAQLARGYTISGNVTGFGAGVLENVCANVVDASNEELWIDGSETDAAGNYTIGPLAPGQYKLQFNDCSESPHWISEWWNNQTDFSQANTITVLASNIAGINAQLAHGYTISGRITETGSGEPLANVCADVQVASNGDYVNGGGSGEDGYYRTEVVPPGQYKVSFGECDGPETHVREFWNDKATWETANVINLTSGDATGIDAALAPGHRIAGHVSDGGQPIANVCVGIFTLSNGTDAINGGYTDENGYYESGAVPYGHYKVQFEDCNDPPVWSTEWYDSKADFASANDVDLTTSNRTLDAVLAPLPTPPGISGEASEDITTTGAEVGGMVNPHGSATTYHVEYGSTPAYGQRMPATDAPVGSDSVDHYVGQVLSGLAPNTTYHFRIVATNGAGTTNGTDHSFTTAALQPPDVSASVVVESITTTGAAIGGTVNPRGSATTYHFDYGTTTGYGSHVPAVDASVGSDTTPHYVSQSVSGLTPGTTYHFRLVATNGVGTTYGSDHTFATTALQPPEVDASAVVEDVTTTSAEIGGTVNPRGSATTYHFEYGATAAYGLRVPTLDATVGSDNTGHYVGEVVSGLTASTTYHFRLVATNVAGTTYGSDHTFTTAAATVTPAGDKVAPQVAISCPLAVAAGTAASAHWTASDAGSGLATPASGDVALDTATAGTRTAIAPDARDNAGNVTSGVSCNYSVTPATPAAVPVIKIVTTKVIATRKGDVAVKLSCSAAPCRGTLGLKAIVKVAGKKKAITLRPKAFTLVAGRTGTVKFRLSKTQLALLKKAKKATATATVKFTAGGGKTVTGKVTILRPKA